MDRLFWKENGMQIFISLAVALLMISVVIYGGTKGIGDRDEFDVLLKKGQMIEGTIKSLDMKSKNIGGKVQARGYSTAGGTQLKRLDVFIEYTDSSGQIQTVREEWFHEPKEKYSPGDSISMYYYEKNRNIKVVSANKAAATKP